MPDERMTMMLRTAGTLAAEDLDLLRGGAVATAVADFKRESVRGGPGVDAGLIAGEAAKDSPAVPRRAKRRPGPSSSSALPRGEYERRRTRESKVSTACVGDERDKHDWWPVGTQLEGRMAHERFTATVVENAQVKSGRSLLITSGPASGKVCISPTRAAIEATEHYRKSRNLGRAGGVTNGWTFWRPQGK